MPYLKTFNISIVTKVYKNMESVKVNVNTSGEFYVTLDEKFKSAMLGFFDERSVRLSKADGKINVYSGSLDRFEETLQRAMKSFYEPEIIKENIIIYNIQSDVSFAIGKDGRIVPNAGWEDGATWGDNLTDGMYGDHHATKPSYGGYSLKIGAKALTKITYKYGDEDTVEYEMYYGDGTHLIYNDPASRLNAWCSMSLDYDKCKQIPYSDKSADFFYNLLYGMAKLSKMIQEATFDQQNLLALIESGLTPLEYKPTIEE